MPDYTGLHPHKPTDAKSHNTLSSLARNPIPAYASPRLPSSLGTFHPQRTYKSTSTSMPSTPATLTECKHNLNLALANLAPPSLQGTTAQQRILTPRPQYHLLVPQCAQHWLLHTPTRPTPTLFVSYCHPSQDLKLQHLGSH